MEADQVIEGAIDHITENGWCQGELLSPGGEACLRGAMMIGAGAETFNHVNGLGLNANNMDWDALFEATQRVEREVKDSIPFWNDQPGTSKEDVILVLKRSLED